MYVKYQALERELQQLLENKYAFFNLFDIARSEMQQGYQVRLFSHISLEEKRNFDDFIKELDEKINNMLENTPKIQNLKEKYSELEKENEMLKAKLNTYKDIATKTLGTPERL